MAVLDQLKITDASHRRDSSPIGRFRRRLVEALETQLNIANADNSGTPLSLYRQRWVKDEAGEKVLRQIPLRLRRWWWKDEKGVVHLALKYGARPLEIAPGKRAIEIGSPAELPTKIAILCEAVRAGELDACLAPFGSKVPQTKKLLTPSHPSLKPEAAKR